MYAPSRVVCLILFLVIFYGGSSVWARDFSTLQAEVWIDLEPMGEHGPIRRLSKDDASKALLEEARLVFSGMIYGWDFEYGPGDSQRKAAETFTMTPDGQIPLADPNLEFRENRGDASTVYLRVRYFPREAELARLEGWSSQTLSDAGGTGFGSYFEGTKARLVSLDNACKDAIRSYARTIVHAKPSRISGRLILMAVPRVIVVSGSWKTEVRVRIQIGEIENYRNY